MAVALQPGVLYRSQAVFSEPQSSLDLATAKPQSGDYADADIRGLFWSMAPVEGADPGALKPLQVKLTASADGHVLTSAIIEFIDALPAVSGTPTNLTRQAQVHVPFASRRCVV